MGETKWTEEQRSVIEARSCNLLVSASAGSGKTAVLVERIIGLIMDPHHPVDLDRVLVVTFTNAAAAQLRERIRAALSEALEKDPADARLQHQMTLLMSDHIMTVHSFCLEVIKNHFHVIGLDPVFRIGDEGELRLLREETAEQVLEEAYSAGAPEFLNFTDSFAPGKSDGNLADIILKFFAFSNAHPDPKGWRASCAAAYSGKDRAAEHTGEEKPDPDGGEGEDPGESNAGALFGNAPWVQYAMETIRSELQDLSETTQETLRIADGPDGPSFYKNALLSDLDYLERCADAENYRDMAQVFAEKKGFVTLGRAKKTDVFSEEKKQLCKNRRDDVKDRFKNLRDSWFFTDVDSMVSDMAAAGRLIRELVLLTDRFEELFTQAKTDRKMLDFSDLEHLAIRILVDRNENGAFVPSAVAREYEDYFAEVCVDEYQDSNPVQELILWAVSKENCGGRNRFMVGDVKQSIYRFRMASPEIFMEKYHTYPVDPVRAEDGNLRIDLFRNFRSRKEVLDAVNLVFCQIMRQEVGGIEYGEREALYPGAQYPADPENPAFVQPELILVSEDDFSASPAAGSAESDAAGAVAAAEGSAAGAAGAAEGYAGENDTAETAQDSSADDSVPLDRKQAEAKVVAERIMQIVGKERVWDSKAGAFRPAGYGDIAILLRTVSEWADVFGREFAERGIPTRSVSRTGYFSAPEVRTVLAYLNVLDNPMQDIPLAAVLRSPIGGLSDEELAEIRIAVPEGSWYECVREFLRRAEGGDSCPGTAEVKTAEGANAGRRTGAPGAAFCSGTPSLTEKLRRFRDMTKYLRAKVSDTPIHQLIALIYEKTEIVSIYGAMPGGAQRRANLEMLLTKAVDFEATSYRGLFHFIRYIEKMQKYEVDFGEAQVGGDSDSVTIMSIHKSKGLEFPIVFVCGLGKSFNRSDSREAVSLSSRFGAGCDAIDLTMRTRRPTILEKAIRSSITRDTVGEELRVLYVAMTRAEEKLIISGWCDDLPKTVKAAGETRYRREEKLSASKILRTDSCLFWILESLSRHDAESSFFDRYDVPLMEKSGVEKMDGSFRILTGKEVLAGSAVLEAEREWTGLSLRDFENGKIYDREVHEYLRRTLEKVSPAADHSAIPAKISVSELKSKDYEAEMARVEAEEGGGAYAVYAQGDSTAEDSAAIAAGSGTAADNAVSAGAAGGAVSRRKKEHLVPDFMREKGGTAAAAQMSGAEAGTVVHSFLAALDFTEPPEEAAVLRQLESMLRCDRIHKSEKAAVERRIAVIVRFLGSDLGRRMGRAMEKGCLFREMPFVIKKSAAEIDPAWDANESVLVQGIIDAYFREGNSIILIDYKTDFVKKGMEESLLRRYRSQFLLYREALEQLTGLPVTEMYLYSLSLGEAIPVTADA